MAVNNRHKILNYKNYNIHYFVSGDGNAPCIVCLHPAFADHNCFNLQVIEWCKSYKVIAIDMLGHGLSQPDKTNDKIDETIQHIIAILKVEQVDKIHLVGVSLGSLMAQYFAILHPKTTLSISILGGYNINYIDKDLRKAQRKEGLKWLFKILFSMESFRRYAAKQTALLNDSQEGFHEMSLKFTRKSLRYMSGISNIIQNRENTAAQIPRLIMVGDHDLELAQQKAQAFHKLEPQSIFKIILNAGHCANMDNPQAFNQEILNFLHNIK